MSSMVRKNWFPAWADQPKGIHGCDIFPDAAAVAAVAAGSAAWMREIAVREDLWRDEQTRASLPSKDASSQ